MPAVNGAVMIWPIAPPIDNSTDAPSDAPTELGAPRPRSSPATVNGIDTAPATRVATSVPRIRIPNTRQNDQHGREAEHRPQKDECGDHRGRDRDSHEHAQNGRDRGRDRDHDDRD